MQFVTEKCALPGRIIDEPSKTRAEGWAEIDLQETSEVEAVGDVQTAPRAVV